MKNNIAPTTEFVSAILLDKLDGKEIAEFKADPRSFIFAKMSMQISDDISIAIPHNDSNTVHLALPYYEFMDEVTAEAMKDSQLKDTVGGEIFISIIIGGAIGAAIAAAATSAGTIGIVSTAGIIGAAVGAGVGAVVGTGITTGVAAGAAYGANQNNSK